MLNYETTVRFMIVSNTLTHKDITSIIGLRPNKYWEIGDLKAKGTIMRQKDNCWMIEYKVPKSSDPYIMDKLIDKLLMRISPYSKNIRSLSENSNIDSITLSLVQYVDDDYHPQFYFKPEVVNQINELGAGIFMDLFVFKVDEE